MEEEEEDGLKERLLVLEKNFQSLKEEEEKVKAELNVLRDKLEEETWAKHRLEERVKELSEELKEVKEKVSAKDRWAKGKAILKGGERESQKSQHSAASGGSSGSAGPQTSAVAVPNMVPRFERIINQHICKPLHAEVISKE